MTNVFERYLTVWVALCIIGGIVLGKIAPGVAHYLDGLAIYVGEAPVVSIPIAVCLFFMMYPIMVKIDFGEVIKAGKSGKPVFLTLFVNWAIKPFTMYAIALFFLGTLFYGLIGPEAVDYVKMPFGLNLPGVRLTAPAQVVMHEGVKMLEVPLWRSYLAGCILLGIAPCTAMVLVWGYLSRGNDGLTLVMVAINSLTMLVLYGVLGGILARRWKAARALASPGPLHRDLCRPALGSRLSIPEVDHFRERSRLVSGKIPARLDPGNHHCPSYHARSPFQLQGRRHRIQPPDDSVDRHSLFIQTNLIFWLGYGLAKLIKLPMPMRLRQP
jgi:arsenite transporter